MFFFNVKGFIDNVCKIISNIISVRSDARINVSVSYMEL